MKTLEVGEKSFDELVQMSYENKEGLVIAGVGKPYKDWAPMLVEKLKEEKITKEDPFTDVFLLTGNVKGNRGRKDLVLIFDMDKLHMGKLAMFRLQCEGMSWVSDFVVNYKTDYK